MKKFILFLIAVFCISSFTSTIEAKSNRYEQQRKTYKKTVRKMQKKSNRRIKSVSAKDFGKFRSKLTGKVYNGNQPLTCVNNCKKKCY